jgi:putative FmdB family regulatory protein
MPIYEYRCERCEQTFEVMQKFSDDPLNVHEGCGGAVERLLSSPAFQFKGSGWYVTDYARKNGPAANKAEAKTESTDTKTDSKKESTSTPAKSDASASKSESK